VDLLNILQGRQSIWAPQMPQPLPEWPQLPGPRSPEPTEGAERGRGGWADYFQGRVSDWVQRQRERMNMLRGMPIPQPLQFSPQIPPFGGTQPIPLMQFGGRLMPGQTGIVGEAGRPEMVTAGQGGARVTPMMPQQGLVPPTGQGPNWAELLPFILMALQQLQQGGIGGLGQPNWGMPRQMTGTPNISPPTRSR